MRCLNGLLLFLYIAVTIVITIDYFLIILLTCLKRYLFWIFIFLQVSLTLFLCKTFWSVAHSYHLNTALIYWDTQNVNVQLMKSVQHTDVVVLSPMNEQQIFFIALNDYFLINILSGPPGLTRWSMTIWLQCQSRDLCWKDVVIQSISQSHGFVITKSKSILCSAVKHSGFQDLKVKQVLCMICYNWQCFWLLRKM